MFEDIIRLAGTFGGVTMLVVFWYWLLSSIGSF